MVVSLERFENMFFLSDKDNQTEIEKNVIDSDTEIKIDNNSNNNYNKEQDAEGTVVSNELRVEQITKLTNRWKEKPIFGFGYGGFVEGYTRTTIPNDYQFEVTSFALLMKTGIIGIIAWAMLIFF